MSQRRVSILLLLFAGFAVGVDAFRVGFFADDFHFIDVARRVPLPRLLTGAEGLWPWYRPISRELYFWLVAHAGDFAAPCAHLVSLVVFSSVLFLLWRIGTRLLPAAVVALAIGLFTTTETSRFVLASPSCFQDLFALFWMLVAIDAHEEGHHGRAAVAAGLAPLAKETGFLVFPLLAAYDLLLRRRSTSTRTWTIYGVAALAAGLIHLGARLSWPSAGSVLLRTALPAGQMSAVATQTLQGFIAVVPQRWPDGWAWARGVLACGALFLLVRSGGSRREEPVASQSPSVRFLLAAILLGVVPAILGYGFHLTIVQAYYFFPAMPWMCFLLALAVERGARSASRVLVAALIVWNVAGGAYVAPDMARAESWSPGPIGWPWAVRLSAEARSLGADLRRELGARPESLVVLYDGLPSDSYFQTLDGPATRVLLGDPRVRAYLLNAPPSGLRKDRLAILTFNASTLHLQKVTWPETEALLRAMKAVVGSRGDVALALVEYGAGGDSSFDWGYCRAAAELLLQGPTGFQSALHAIGVRETTEVEASALSADLSRVDHGLGRAMSSMLESPRSASRHAALADSMLARDVLPGAGMELRIATVLDPARYGDRYRLALVMLHLGGLKEARAELRSIAADPRAGPLATRAEEVLAQLPRPGESRRGAGGSD